MEFSLLPRLLIQSFGSGLFVFSFLRSNSKCHAASAILKLRRCPPYPGIFDPFTNWTAILWMMLKPQKAKGFWKKGLKLKPKDKRKSSYHLLWGFDMIWAAVSGIVSGVMLMSLDISSFTSQLTTVKLQSTRCSLWQSQTNHAPVNYNNNMNKGLLFFLLAGGVTISTSYNLKFETDVRAFWLQDTGHQLKLYIGSRNRMPCSDHEYSRNGARAGQS